MLILAMIAPWLGVLLVLASPRRDPRLAFGSAGGAAVVSFMSWAGLAFRVSADEPARLDRPWIEGIGLRLALEVDALSLVFLLFTAFAVPVALLVNWRDPARRRRSVPALVLVLEGALFVAFAARDPLLHWFAQDIVAFVLFVAIALGGGRAGREAGISFILHAALGSLPLLVALLGLRARGGDLTLPLEPATRAALSLPLGAQWLGAVAFLLAAATRLGLPPLQGWRRDLEATPMGLKSLMLVGWYSLGTYPFLRFARPLFTEAYAALAPVLVGGAILALALAGLRRRVAATGARRHAETLAFGAALAALGLVTGSPRAAAGGVLVVFAFDLAELLRFLIAGDAGSFLRLPRRVADATTTLLPGLLAFAGGWAILCGALELGVAAAVGALAATLVGVSGGSREEAEKGAVDPSRIARTLSFGIAIVLVVSGLGAGFLLDLLEIGEGGP